MKKSLVNINLNLLPDFEKFDAVNSDWNIEKYLNYNYDINSAIAFCKMYFPTFILHKDCVILENRFKLSTFNEWYDEFQGEVPLIEKMCNLYEVKDFFHLNSENAEEQKILEFGNILKCVWQINLNLLYPERKMLVSIFKEEDSMFITFFSGEC